MWKFHVIFLVFIFFSVKESSTTYDDRDTSFDTVWTAGSAVNVTFGPEDAVYCRLEDNHFRRVFDGFGPCRVVVDRVTMDHRGHWKLWIGVPGTVIVTKSYVYVDVEAAATVNSTPRVFGSVIGRHSTVDLQCSVPEEHEVVTCTFSDPAGGVFIATGDISQAVHNTVKRYESSVDRNYCTLKLLTPHLEQPGIWRCAVNTTQVTTHGFFAVSEAMLDDDYPLNDNYYSKPELQTVYSSISGMEGDAKTLSCFIDAAIRYCYFRAPNGTVFNIGPSTSSPDYEYVGNGLDAGECGIRFNHISASDEGLWSCNVGLMTNYEEQRAFFDVYINQRLMVNHRWSGKSLVVSLRIFHGPELEYCRFVRSDGLGFTSENVPLQYFAESGEHYGTCALTIHNPIVEDLRPWTIVAKVIGEDGEVSVTTTLDPRGQPRHGLSSTTAILLWSFFGTIFVFLIVVSCLPKKNREWTTQRAARIRNSFRRQPHPQPQPQPQLQPQPQNVTDLPKPPAYTDILTELPQKY